MQDVLQLYTREACPSADIVFSCMMLFQPAPGMKALIYKLFTRESGVTLTFDALRYLESNVSDEAELRNLVAEYNRQDGARAGDLEAMKRILGSFRMKVDPRRIYDLVPQKCTRTNYLKKYKFLREKIGRATIPIYLLGEAPATIFGCYYRDKDSGKVLEDDGECVPLDMSGYSGDIFLCENMFIAAEGVRAGGRFLVRDVILPKAGKEATSRLGLVERECRMVFLSDFEINEGNMSALKRICERHLPDVAVLMGRLCGDGASSIPIRLVERHLGSHSMHTELVLCPHADDVYPSYLPKRMLEKPECPALKMAVNPFFMEFKSCSVAIIRKDVFRAKERGRFMGGNFVESFVRSFISQYSFDPFGLAGLDIERMPDVFVVGQDFYPFVARVGGPLFISCPSFGEEKSFVILDLPSNQVEIARDEEE
jgi:DNA polymerase epsilon subunit 2